MNSNLIIITGLPGTGKTSLGKFLSEKLNYPFISKDKIKELIFDSLGWSDREWSKKVGQTTYRILDYVLEEELIAGHSLVLESNFKPKFDNTKFQLWQEKYQVNTIQILCHSESEVLFERFKARAQSGERHPGHDDTNSLEEFKQVLAASKADSLDLSGHILEVDTTDFSSVNYPSILQEVNKSLK